MADRLLPLHKRFPGQHVASAKFIFPSGSRVEVSGPYPKTVAELAMLLLSIGPVATELHDEMAALLLKLQERPRG